MGLARVLLVEDEPFARTMVAATLAALGLEVVAAVGSSREAIDVSLEIEFDVAVLDLDLGAGPSGIDVAYALRERNSQLGLVFLTSFTDPRLKDSGERPLPRGARFIVKARLEDPKVLRDAVLDVRRSPLRPSDRGDGLGTLTANQVDVLHLVAAGRSNAEIADEFGVSEKAVERTIQRVLDALGIERGTGNVRVRAARAYVELAGKVLPSV